MSSWESCLTIKNVIYHAKDIESVQLSTKDIESVQSSTKDIESVQSSTITLKCGALRGKCPNTEFFLARIQGNTNQKKIRIRTLFTQWCLLEI